MSTLLNPGTTDAPLFQLYTAGEGDAESALRESFEFLRRMGRYTPRTLQAILMHGDRMEQNRLDGTTDYDGPTIIRAERPSRYDPDTEVKFGGVVGALVYMPDGDDRVLLAVHKDSRRQGVGRNLLQHAERYLHGERVAWVGRTNRVGQMFLLSQGWLPTQLGAAGGVCYTPAGGGADPVEEDDTFLRNPAIERIRDSLRHRGGWDSEPEDACIAEDPAGAY